MQYKVIHNFSNKVEKLEADVNKLLKEGWELVGPAIPISPKNGGMILTQTLIKK